MKKFKKSFSLLLTLMLTISAVFSISMFASAEDGTKTVTIANAKVGETYTFYKVLSVTNSGDNYAYSVENDWVSAWQEITGATGKTGAELNAAVADYIKADNVAAVAVSLKGKIPAGITGKSVTAADTTCTIDLDSDGYYLMVPSGGKASVVFSLATVVGDTFTITNKSTYPAPDKTVKTADSDNYVKKATASVGEVIGYKVTGKVPDTSGYTTYNFVVKDTLDTGLAYADTLNLVVKVGETTLTADSDYTAATEGQNLTITFANIKNYAKDSDIVITYDGKVTADSGLTKADSLKNSVTFTYSNDTSDVTKTATSEPSITEVYVASLQVKKVDKDGNALADAEFKLEGTRLTTSGTYTGTSGVDGLIPFKGVAVGTYTLTETKAPDGYNKLANAITVVVKFDAETNKWTYNAGEGDKDLYDADGNIVPIEIENSSGNELPSTGGFGTYAIYGIGAILVVAGLIIIITKMRRKED